MPSQSGRDLLLKIGDGGDPEVFQTLGAARLTAMTISNDAQATTSFSDAGHTRFLADAGVQDMQVQLQGLFKDSQAEEYLRAVALERGHKNYELVFPNGDTYRAVFVVDSYSRTGDVDGFEAFSAVLSRSGVGTFTAAG